MKVDLKLLNKIDESISMGTTGEPGSFCEKLGVSKRSFHSIREYMITEHDAPIAYSAFRKTYYYTKDYEFFAGDLSKIKVKLMKEILETLTKSLKVVVLLGIISF